MASRSAAARMILPQNEKKVSSLSLGPWPLVTMAGKIKVLAVEVEVESQVVGAGILAGWVLCDQGANTGDGRWITFVTHFSTHFCIHFYICRATLGHWN